MLLLLCILIGVSFIFGEFLSRNWGLGYALFNDEAESLKWGFSINEDDDDLE
jgi:hypothetical protein